MAKKTKAAKTANAPTAEEQEPKKVRNMAETLSKYRAKYKASTSTNGRSSLNNGDVVAKTLEGKTPEQTIAMAEQLCGLKKGELQAKYDRLNDGQKRMNAGNRIRAAWKRGDIDEKALKAAATH